MRGSVSFFMLCLLLAIAAALSSCASVTDSVGDAPKAWYHRSLIEVGLMDRVATYGCAEFAFHSNPSALESRVVAIDQGRVENVLALATANCRATRGGAA